jgi:excisionase family DNA binding protein
MVLLTIDELCEKLKMPKSWIYARTMPRSQSQDRIPSIRLGKYLRFDHEQVEQWLADHCIKGGDR